MEFWIFLGVIVLLVLFVISIYNRIISLNERCDQAYADIDVQLKQRHDLVPNLVNTVKGYASHEQETLDAVIKARQNAVDASGPAAQGPAEGVLGASLGRLFALAENYPDLKANTNFLELQRELSDIENKIAAARRFFNSAIQEFNTIIQQIPGNFIAPMGKFEKRDFFEIPENARVEVEATPDVSF